MATFLDGDAIMVLKCLSGLVLMKEVGQVGAVVNKTSEKRVASIDSMEVDRQEANADEGRTIKVLAQSFHHVLKYF